MVDISGLDKAEVLAALHSRSRAQGIGVLHDRGPLSVDECRAVIDAWNGGKLYFDYLRGRVMKVDISKDEFDPRLYDRDNGSGAAQEAIDALLAA